MAPVKALAGSTGQRRILLGQLRRDAAGALLLEDASGHVPLSLRTADMGPVQSMAAEGMCMLCEGTLQSNGTFECAALADPPLESRADALASLQGLNMSGATPLRYGIRRSIMQH